jgi:hypothetical protein
VIGAPARGRWPRAARGWGTILKTDTVEVTIGDLDPTVISVYFFVVQAIGFRVDRNTEIGEYLFLAGRGLTWGVKGTHRHCRRAPRAALRSAFAVQRLDRALKTTRRNNR